MREILEILRENKLYVKISKCEFGKTELDYLGHRVSAEDIQVISEKVKAIQKWSALEDQTKLNSFLELTGFYCRFVKIFAKIARALILLLEKGYKWE